MGIVLRDLGQLDGLIPDDAPRDGMIWDARGVWARVDDGRVTWTRPLPRRPSWSGHRRWLYVSADGALAALDARTGQALWQVEAAARALTAWEGGVHALVGDQVVTLDRRDGRARVSHPVVGDSLTARGSTAWVGGPAGVVRVDGGVRRVSERACRALVSRSAGVHALLEGGGIVVDDGMALAFPFPDADQAVLLPWGEDDWLACDRRTGAGVRRIDARGGTRWAWEGPPARDVAVAGPCVAVDAGDGVYVATSLGGGSARIAAPTRALFGGESYFVLVDDDTCRVIRVEEQP